MEWGKEEKVFKFGETIILVCIIFLNNECFLKHFLIFLSKTLLLQKDFQRNFKI